jgi:beta-galactosidase
MFDYNTHQDFGSGDRICYHGILDMFRNPKLAAVVYESQKDASQGVVLEISSNMDIGEHPACYLGSVYAFTNADAVRMYKNGGFIAEFSAKDSPFSSLEHGPILIDDFIGNQLVEKEGYPPKKAAMIKKLLQAAVKYGFQSLPFSAKLLAARLILFHGMKYEDGVELYGKYIGNWGGYVTSYRFDAVVDGKVVKSVTKTPSERLRLKVQCSQQALKERSSYDVAAFRLSMRDQNNNLLSFYQEPVQITLEGPAEIIGPSVISLKGGMGGSFIRTTGEAGTVTVKFSGRDFEEVTVPLEVTLSEGINMDEKEK